MMMLLSSFKRISFFARRFPGLALLILALPLAGCETMNGLKDSITENMPAFSMFHPLSDDLANMAAPTGLSLGNNVYCVTGNGAAKFGTAWLDYKSSSFALNAGADTFTNIPLISTKNGAKAYLKGVYDEEGQKMVFCPLQDGPPDAEVACTSLYVFPEDLDVGIKRTFDVPEGIRGGAIACAHSTDKLLKL